MPLVSEHSKLMAMELSTALTELQAFQARRIARTYRDLTAEAEFEALGAFFFDQIYAPRDFSFRNTSIRTLHRKLGATLPRLVVDAVGRVIELHDLTDRLDRQVARRLVEMGAERPLRWRDYGRAYREAGSYEARRQQIELLLEATRRIHQISQWRAVGWVLGVVDLAASLGGMGAVMHFLHSGYQAFHRVRYIERFLNAVSEREYALNDFLFGKIPHQALPDPLPEIVPPEAAAA
ncbi:MAG: hypothetical protein D6715_05620 [Calditrichaeota bacterium]|nr:MAG: hypothetical protein D6715_05620 [Calditrichota bacterium]